ncbi:hypothetical protein IRT45_21435 [Nocardia sp. BSTN01]|uniref:hypothetical protein n=1 Tax=Nocardia sp. BSTN01 TaxID=2783665 RepID=UPI00188F14A2|nr:hypothetical protein [Nocardia sp. BSTN01]MBF4999711.1 hypothetical protein [Nocardia sp. BSTN01]
MATGATRAELARELKTGMCTGRGFTMHRVDDGYVFRKPVAGEHFSGVLELFADLVLKYGELQVTCTGSLAVPALQTVIDAVPDAAVSNLDLSDGRPYSTELAIESFGRNGSLGAVAQEILIETDDDVHGAVEELLGMVDGTVSDWATAVLAVEPLLATVTSAAGDSHPLFVRRLVLLLLSLNRAEDAVQVMDTHMRAKLHFGERESRAPKFEQHLLDSFPAYRLVRETRQKAQSH